MINDGLVVRVECYAGHKGDETPRRFFLDDRVVDVVEVLDRYYLHLTARQARTLAADHVGSATRSGAITLSEISSAAEVDSLSSNPRSLVLPLRDGEGGACP